MIDNELEFYAEKLMENKIKLTAQRQAILKFFLNIQKPVSLDEIYQNVILDFQKIKRSTVENTLDIFVKVKIIKELKNKNESPEYEVLASPEYACGVNCIKCGINLDIMENGKKINKYMKDILYFTSLNINLKIQGVCADCKGIRII